MAFVYGNLYEGEGRRGPNAGTLLDSSDDDSDDSRRGRSSATLGASASVEKAPAEAVTLRPTAGVARGQLVVSTRAKAHVAVGAAGRTTSGSKPGRGASGGNESRRHPATAKDLGGSVDESKSTRGVRHVPSVRRQRPAPEKMQHWSGDENVFDDLDAMCRALPSHSTDVTYRLGGRHVHASNAAAHAAGTCCCAHERRYMLDSVKKVRGELTFLQTSMAKAIWRRVFRRVVLITFHAWRRRWHINRKLVAGLRRHRGSQGMRRWRDNVREIRLRRAMTRKAHAHYCSALARKHLGVFRARATELKRLRALATKAAAWIRKRAFAGAFNKWRLETDEAAYQRAAAAASHAAIVATRAMKRMFYFKDLSPAFRAWVDLHRRHLDARAALEAAGDFAARVFFLSAAVFSRWRHVTQILRREKNEEAAAANERRAAELDGVEEKLSSLLAKERQRGRAEKERELALAKMGEAAALRRSQVMERERREAIAAVEAEREKVEEAYARGGKFEAAIRAEEAEAFAAREVVAAEEREWLQRAVESAWNEVLWYRKRNGDPGAEMSLHDHLVAVTGPHRASSMLPAGYKAPWNHPSNSDPLPLSGAQPSGESPPRKVGLAGAIASIARGGGGKGGSSSSSSKPRSVAAVKAESLIAQKTTRATAGAWLKLSKFPDARRDLREFKEQSKKRQGAASVSASGSRATSSCATGMKNSKMLSAGSAGHLPSSKRPRVPSEGRRDAGPATRPRSRPWGTAHCSVGARRHGDAKAEGAAPTRDASAKAVVATLSRLDFSEAQWSAARESFVRTHEDAEVAAAVAADFDRERKLQAGSVFGKTVQRRREKVAEAETMEAAREGAGSPIYEGEDELAFTAEQGEFGEDGETEARDGEDGDDEGTIDWDAAAEDAAVAAAAVAGDTPSPRPYPPANPRSQPHRQRSRSASFAIDLDVEEEADHERLVRIRKEDECSEYEAAATAEAEEAAAAAQSPRPPPQLLGDAAEGTREGGEAPSSHVHIPAAVPVPLTPGGYDSDDSKLFGSRPGSRAKAVEKEEDEEDDDDWVFRRKPVARGQKKETV